MHKSTGVYFLSARGFRKFPDPIYIENEGYTSAQQGFFENQRSFSINPLAEQKYTPIFTTTYTPLRKS